MSKIVITIKTTEKISSKKLFPGPKMKTEKENKRRENKNKFFLIITYQPAWKII